MDLHPGEEIVFEGHPSWRAALAFYITGLVGAAVIGALAGVIFDPTTGALVWLGLFVVVLVVGFFRLVATTYVVSSQRLYIRRGLLARRVQQTRIDRVQNVNTRQSIVQRLLRVGMVDFDTAGTDDSDFTFRGIANPSAIVEAVDRAQREQARQGPV
ncbi:MAG: PH domain-containing protein [Solirubrobacteraceae bacterium]